MAYVITDEYMEQRKQIRKEHRDVAHLECLKMNLDKLQGWMEQIRDDGKQDGNYSGWDASEVDDFINTLSETYSKLYDEAEELYKKYGLVRKEI